LLLGMTYLFTGLAFSLLAAGHYQGPKHQLYPCNISGLAVSLLAAGHYQATKHQLCPLWTVHALRNKASDTHNVSILNTLAKSKKKKNVCIRQGPTYA
jgi:hypothetical protein